MSGGPGFEVGVGRDQWRLVLLDGAKTVKEFPLAVNDMIQVGDSILTVRKCKPS